MRRILSLLALLLAFSWSTWAQDTLPQEDTLTEEEIAIYMGTLDDDGLVWEGEPEPGRLWTLSVILLYVLLAVTPALVLVYYVFRKDRLHPEPPRQLVKAFGMGVLSVPVAILFARLVLALVPSPAYPPLWLETLRLSFVGAGIPEECAKLLLLWLFLRKCRDFDEHMDGIVYAVCVGMGFAAVENVMYILGALEGYSNLVYGIIPAFRLSVSRGLLSIPGHFAFAVFMGYYYSLASFRPSRRGYYLSMALLVPIAIHGSFDYILMRTEAAGPLLHVVLMLLFLAGFLFMQKAGSRRIAAALTRDGGTPR